MFDGYSFVRLRIFVGFGLNAGKQPVCKCYSDSGIIPVLNYTPEITLLSFGPLLGNAQGTGEPSEIQ